MTEVEPTIEPPAPVTATTPAAGPPTRPIVVVDIGLYRFAAELKSRGLAVAHGQWTPPAGGDAKLVDPLAKLGG